MIKKVGVVLMCFLMLSVAASPALALPETKAQALRHLNRKCEENKRVIKAYGRTAKVLLANGGKNESVTSILVHVDRSIPRFARGLQCSDIFAAYVTLRGGHA